MRLKAVAPMAVKKALLVNIKQMLVPDTEDRRLAEERNKALEVTEDYGPLLIDIAMDGLAEFAVRQMSLVLLKQYLSTHWDNHNTKFKEPLINEGDKILIKARLPQGLKDEASKIRSGISVAMAIVAKHDWPDNWPQLLTLIDESIHSSNNDLEISGALTFLEELIHVLDGEQIRHIAPHILTSLFIVVENSSDKFAKGQRSVALAVTTNIITVVSLSIDYPKDMFRTLIPKFMQLVKFLLQSEKCLKFKNSLIKSLNQILPRATHDFMTYLPILLPSIWEELRNCGDMYLVHVATEFTDTDEELLINNAYLIDLSFSLFEFIQILFNLIQRDQKMFVEILPDIMYYVISFSVINKDLENEWSSNASSYMMDVDKDSSEVSVRYSGIALIHVITLRYGLQVGFPNDALFLQYLSKTFDHQPIVLAVCQAANKHMTNVDRGALCSSEQYVYSLWWRVNEAIMYIISKMDSLFIEQYQANTLSNFDLRGYLMRWLNNDPNISNNSFLFGRILWMASHFSTILDSQDIASYIEVSAQYILSKNYIHVMSAIKSISFHCKNLHSSINIQVIINALPTIIERLLSIVEAADSNCLYLIIECLTTLIKLDKSYAAMVENRIAPICIGIFLSSFTSPLLRSVTTILISELAGNPNCCTRVQQRFVPQILEILQTPEEKLASDIQALALESLTILVKVSRIPLSEIMLKPTLFIVAATTRKSTDYITIQSGSECLRFYLTVAPEQVCSLVDSEGKPILDYIFDVIYYMLEPSTEALSCSRIGRLFITLCAITGAQLQNDTVEMTLRAVLSKLQRCEPENSVISESLLLIFAHLLQVRTEAILSFLTTVPGPMGESALKFVLFRWLGMDVKSANTYEKKISFLGLCKLFEFCITNKDRRLDGIVVPGDLFTPPMQSSYKSNRNRRVASPERFYEVSALERIFKIVVNEFLSQMSSVAHRNMERPEVPTLNTSYNFEQRCDCLSLNDTSFAEMSPDLEHIGDLDECENASTRDPVYQMNLRDYLAEFLSNFSTSVYFNCFFETLSDSERGTLGAIGVLRQGI